ncbi:transcription accessory protein [Secundilactobacillus oryzae JCM 18671]|uniref:Transcription accessory protein n=1 Tax=Secundilactobacillus oryzae JCM 18671 TaxID=1291743 RepID=A0A081BJE8_9LACO|nr:Tex family protein [Secundilactobacillus oryzae]GAK48166.1 transcription accessory protein [Secundilactobacillus oryzae JCM 18671]
MDEQLIKMVQSQLTQYRPQQVKQTLTMLDEGNTVPFIARYRKEATGSLDEVQIREIQATFTQIEKLEKRKQEVKNQIEAQDKLTSQLIKQIDGANTLQLVEDLYLPYKQKRRTKAQKAKEAGLMPMAEWVLKYPKQAVTEKAIEFINPEAELTTVEDVMAGVHEIITEAVGERPQFREWIRTYTNQKAELMTKVKSKGKDQDENGVYETYYEFNAKLAKLSSYQVLAINRGEDEGILSVAVQVDTDAILHYLHFQLIGQHTGPAVTIVEEAAQDAYKRFIGPAIEREIRRELTEQAAAHAIDVFGDNLYHLLMQSPMKNRVVLGFDPAYRTGCKLAVLDPNGKFLAKQVIYPHKPAPANKRQAAAGELKKLISDYQVEIIAIGNGTASRESEQFVSEIIKQLDQKVSYVIVNEAGASVYSASQVARDEFPDFNVEERSAVSIGRRLQDPLSELIKIDPKSVGVGQYQHDVSQTQLDDKLDQVVETAVNQVGVNVNTASLELLTHISGLTKTTAANIVAYRYENGSFTSRPQLKKVPRLGPKAYEQAVGFLRIIDGDNPLDNTDIHPESYPLTKKLMKQINVNLSKLGKDRVPDNVSTAQLARDLDAGQQTITDILASLRRPGRDLRDDMPAPILRTDVLTMDDLKPGMQLQGAVRNVVDFGAFVDVGVKQDGLVHISHLTTRFIPNPSDIVSVGDIVTVWVLDVDTKRNRIQLTMVNPNGADQDD